MKKFFEKCITMMRASKCIDLFGESHDVIRRALIVVATLVMNDHDEARAENSSRRSHREERVPDAELHRSAKPMMLIRSAGTISAAIVVTVPVLHRIFASLWLRCRPGHGTQAQTEL